MKKIRLTKQLFSKVLSIILLFIILDNIEAATVPVHDPSIIVVYKDVAGNSFSSNDTEETRTKYYYVFGTQLGAAYSLDMMNWTSFTPSFTLSGNISQDYYEIFKEEADYAGHFTTGDVKGNLWAPDIIYNEAMNKWCLYFSLSGNAFKSTVILLTADQIEGPYTKQGVVMCSGFTNNQNDLGRHEYNKVMGTTNIPERYLRNGQWFNDYGVSCIDPSVIYDENGDLWMNYGSWSGGIFLIKLDNSTGFRDTGHDYGYGSNPGWDGSRLRYDPYLGLHIAGGYYVSGEGPYIEYLQDADGVGYYYLFMSYGFYSPEGGYSMRVFRSSTIDGIYTDVSGDDAVFANWTFNYGNDVQHGFPIMQNYKWSWWEDGAGEIAQGHNSVLQDDDGKIYLIYHRKFDNGTAHHNVEVHQLYFNSYDWVVASPFEYREGFGLTTTEYNAEDISGVYGVIAHDPVDYENLATNIEQQVYLNADGTITGAFTGDWVYNYSDERQFISLETSVGNFEGVICEELMNGLSSKTIAFTALDHQNERAIWGYKKTYTTTFSSVKYNKKSLTVGEDDYSLAWDDYEQFHTETIGGDFEVEYVFHNDILATENWQNWALALENGDEVWHLRADAWSNSTFSGSTVGYKYSWDWDTEFKETFANNIVRLKVKKIGSTINLFAFVEDELVYQVSCKDAPEGDYTLHLGGEAVYLDVHKIAIGQIDTRQLVGTVNNDGTYPAIFNSDLGITTEVTGDFELRYNFNNYHNTLSSDNWDNFILRATSVEGTMLLRADAFAFDIKGANTYSYDWDWNNFLDIINGANIDLVIQRKLNVITYTFKIKTREGQLYNYQVVNSNAPDGNMTYGFTTEESMVDLFEVEKISTVGGEVITGRYSNTNQLTDQIFTDGKSVFITASNQGEAFVYDLSGRKITKLNYDIGTNKYTNFEKGVYIINHAKVIIVK